MVILSSRAKRFNIVNKYKFKFWAKCPVNKQTIYYEAEIESTTVIKVEKILEEVQSILEGFHEEIADQLHDAFGGRQIITAEHHGVTIITERS